MAVRMRNNRLYLDFRMWLPSGAKVRCFEATGLTDNKKNQQIARTKDKAVKYHLKNGSFNYLSFFPHGSKAKHFRSGSDVRLTDWWDLWNSDKSIRQTSQRNLDYAYQNHIGPHFGDTPLSQIGEHEILVFRKTLEKNLKESSVNTNVRILCSALLKAHKRGLIPKYPCEDIQRLTEQPVRVNPFSFDELRHWLDDLKSRSPEWHDMIKFWSRTGMRPGELYALKWIDLDLYNNTLSIQRTRKPSGGDGPPKTNYSVRDITLRPAVLKCLKRQEARTGLQDGYIWLQENGRQWHSVAMSGKFRFYLRVAGLKHRPAKQMRHTFATLHIAAGESISWVSQTLGHASVDITLKKYNRFIPNLTREDGSAFEAVMEDKKGNIGVTAFINN